MSTKSKTFNLSEHCHVNSNEDEDRFVGVRVERDNFFIYFPIGYDLPNNDDELKSDIKSLLSVLMMFTDKSEKVFHLESTSNFGSVEFPIQAYQNIINYYFDHNGNYFTEVESINKVGNRGKTDWNKTIKTQFPKILGKSIIYFDQVVRISSQNNNSLITRINQYCVYESFDKIGWLYTSIKPEKPDILFDRTLFLVTLYDRLSNTYNDNDKKLFRSMIALIEFMGDNSNYKQFYYGTKRFENVWEKLIDKYFGVTNKDDYFPRAKWTERYGQNKGKSSSALEPDTIMIYKDKYYVLDAKYYRYGVFPRLGISALPQSSDINKQITYGKFVKNNKAMGAAVFNAFVMPFNKSNNEFKIRQNYCNVAEATGDWIKNPDIFERIQGIVVDTRYLLKNYYGNHNLDKELISLEIEKVLSY
jgi:hypothetical protein